MKSCSPKEPHQKHMTTAKELIEEITRLCGDDLERELRITVNVEVCINDEFKLFAVTYNDVQVQTEHPKTVSLSIS
jgi:hypothetical protein